MTKWVSIFFALVFLVMFSFGCTGVSKENKVRCPKCGATFTIDEGLSQEQMSGGGM